MNASSADSASRTQRRYWRRRDAADGWWPWGILPLAGLLGLFLFGWLKTAPAIEAQTQQSVAQLLRSQGVEVRHIEADGRRIRIDAVAGQYDEAQIKALTRRAECRTWAGQLGCPSAVEVNLTRDDASPLAKADSLPVPEEADLPTDPRFHPFRFELDNGQLTLSGEVADERTRSEVMLMATSRFGPVIDRLSISGDAAMPQYRAAALHALNTLERLESGAASWSGGKLSMTGAVSPEKEAALQSLVNGSDLALGELSFRVIRSAANCNQELEAALQQSSIKFGSGSAEIDRTSATLLERLAILAKQCPGNLTIAGHTDNVGDAGMNLALSESRAAAVRDALAAMGVVSERLEVRGYGETQPIADNSTYEGRAKNRRISIQAYENN